jgi:hypothetical protein
MIGWGLYHALPSIDHLVTGSVRQYNQAARALVE